MSTALPSTASPSTAGTRIAATAEPSAWQTLRRGLTLTPEFRQGLALTLVLAVVATLGRVVVPVVVQQTVDRGLGGDGATVDLDVVRRATGLALVAILLTAAAAYGMNRRLFRAAERGLSSLRVTAFRRIHDLSMLTQNAERRGSLVSRVTGDVDTISSFVQFGGLLLLLIGLQLAVATGLMLLYSWQLTVLVWVTFLPFFLFLRLNRRRVAAAYGRVRARVGDMLAAIAEAVVGAPVVRAYGVEAHTASRIDATVTEHYNAAVRAQRTVAAASGVGELASGLATAGVVVAGVLLGVDADISAGELLAFLFLVTLFVTPIQLGTEVLNEAQNAIAGWRRVLAVLDTPTDIADPGAAGVDLPEGPLDVHAEHLGFAYPGGPPVLHAVDVALPAGRRIAVVGETGSGKTTFAKLLVRLLDPVEGTVRLGGVDVSTVRFSSLRRRVLLVPQEGFLFDASLRENLLVARPGADDEVLTATISDLGLTDWFTGLPRGLDTPVGQRGESLSAGERQLVAMVRAALVAPDVLVLDEATSAVDPATERRLSRAFDRLTTGRTSVIIAHRLSTAENADDVLVFDDGRVVERGRSADLVAAGGVYAALHAAWERHAKGP